MTASCGEQPARRKAPQLAAAADDKDYLALVIGMDTLASDQYWKLVFREDSLLSNRPDSNANPFFHYFRGRRLIKQEWRDSAMAQFAKMKGKGPDDDVSLLRDHTILDYESRGGMMVEAELMQKILAAMKQAERLHSPLTFRFYDLMAKAYYQNENESESLEYAERHFKSHPYNTHPVIMQRHYDVSFLLAYRIDDYDKMMLYNALSRKLAVHIGDSLAIARTYDSEAQVLSKRGDFAKSLACSRIYVDYLERTSRPHEIAYNNLATSFNHNGQPDSAIRYYNKAMAMAKAQNSRQTPIYYKGLVESYKLKGDMGNAMNALDSAYGIEVRNLKKIEAVKFAEIHEKYETEKKDRNIAELSSRNALNESVIRQQRWILGLGTVAFLGGIGFLFFLYRQTKLTERNKRLESENHRLIMEQKLLQAQLNPHFIFNSIANLQSLVASGDTRESVRYLSVFSGLLRNVLEQSRKDFISLEEEIFSLENYLQLQQMRYPGLFDYKVELAEGTCPEELLIPPMIIQPFVENSIEHGFRNIQYKGMLTIGFALRDGKLNITVNDNGKGITEKSPGEQKKQSLAQTILKERFQALFTTDCQRARFDVENKANTGGRGVSVHILIPEIRD
ncbi:histidine kinase [Chitinophaga rhizosphaerae]|uniref:histidine kinase n=1 Tax=Chitinophaga rhizosphaerae TaxID=1864947 RepID=UPI00196A8A6A|nr:histidine kinase [Chitinophaga rhizosphaerae]